MILRDDLERSLKEIFNYDDFEDYCWNGLQVEGKDRIEKIGFAVSFNSLLLQELIKDGMDAVIVHHGFFGKDFLHITGPLKEKIEQLLKNGISLFGIHLPLDAHRELGNNAMLLRSFGAEPSEAVDVGYIAGNDAKMSLSGIVKALSLFLEIPDENAPDNSQRPAGYRAHRMAGVDVWHYGPEVPSKIMCVSGGSSSFLLNAVDKGCDTFISGEILEYSPATAMDHAVNYIRLGHYYSEKAGIRALMDKLSGSLSVECKYYDIPNPL